MTDQEWSSSGEVNGGIPEILEATRPWVKTMSIFGFVMVGFMVFVGLMMGLLGTMSGEASLAMLTVLYGAMGLLYLYPALYLFRFSTRINDFLADRSLGSLAAALEQQRVFWKFVTLMILISTVVGFLLAMLLGVISAMMGVR